MKTLTILSTGTACLALLACSTTADPPSGQAGAANVAGSGNTAGATAAGTSSGGSGDNMAGAPAGGTNSGGGSVSVAGSNAGGSGGASGASGGASGASGGASGSATGGASGGSGGGSAGGGAIDLATFAGPWDGALLTYPCDNGNPHFDCNQAMPPCVKTSSSTPVASSIPPANGVASSWKLGGVAGTMYNVKVRIRGVVEVINYKGGTRAVGNASIDVNSTVPGANAKAKDLFHTAGTPLVFGDSGFDYNQYQLNVTPASGGAASVYYLNSILSTESPKVSAKTEHKSFEIDEMPTLKVSGGSTVSLTVRDSNCVQIQNCGDTLDDNSCQTGARSVSLADATPKPPASWTGKVTSGSGNRLGGQFIHFDVISVTVAQ